MRMQAGSPPALREADRRCPRPDSGAAPDPDNQNTEILDDTVLVARAREGDDEAFAVLVHRNTSPLLALARRLMGNASDAEEVVQDSLISAWRRLPEFREDAAFRTWMYRIVANRCHSVLRRHSPTTPLDTVREPVSREAAAEPARAAESAATAEALAGALGRLRPDQRACWVLRELHDLSYKEIAHVVGASEQTVRGRLFRARRTLMKEMASWQ
jgi:RNA polymerase sigma-70 factor, ECF subfamily